MYDDGGDGGAAGAGAGDSGAGAGDVCEQKNKKKQIANEYLFANVCIFLWWVVIPIDTNLRSKVSR